MAIILILIGAVIAVAVGGVAYVGAVGALAVAIAAVVITLGLTVVANS
jgi:hypothetical protein